MSAAEICQGLQSGTLRSVEIVDALLQRRNALDGELKGLELRAEPFSYDGEDAAARAARS